MPLGMIGIVRVLIIKMRNAPMPCRIFLFQRIRKQYFRFLRVFHSYKNGFFPPQKKHPGEIIGKNFSHPR